MTIASIRIEGGLLGPDILDQALAADLPGQRAADFGLGGKRNLTDEIAAAFSDARALWGVFQNRLQRLADTDIATSATRDAWAIPFLGLLGYELRYNPRAHDVDGLSFAISHRAGEADDAPPLHIVGARQELGRVPASGRPRLAPHSLVQEYLNRTEHVWGIVTNGLTLRLLRDSTFVRRQAYVEFDLTGILEEQRFQDFAALYRLIQRTRLPRGLADADQCLLEQYYQHSVEQGGRVREHLRDGVEQCITLLANGFLRHPANDELRQRASPACTGNERITAERLYRQLLVLVYRFLFLLVSEERGLLSSDPLYREHYGIERLRRLLDQRAAFTDHDDLWQSLRALWLLLIKDQPQPSLDNKPMAAAIGLPVLNGELFTPQDLDGFTITNDDLLQALWRLAWYHESSSSPPRRVNYAALDVEELGSVYESLLEFHPHIGDAGNIPVFELLLEGRERRSTGSHYTPPELVAPLIQHALEPVIRERLAAAVAEAELATPAASEKPRRARTQTPAAPAAQALERPGSYAVDRVRPRAERALLSIRICDLACGSGHFLLAAARRLGKELARVRSGEDEPAPERVREAVRDVVTRCIYGVDKNPLAVELCRVALWLETHTADKPLTFLDHRIRCGDSLVGVFDLSVLEQGIPDEAFKPVVGDDKKAAREAKKLNAHERKQSLFHAPFDKQLREIAGRLEALNDLSEDTIEQVRSKAEACRRIEDSADFKRLRLACHVWAGAFFQSFPSAVGTPLTTQTLRTALTTGNIPDARVGGMVLGTAHQQRFLHWPLVFPEVFAAGGFDVILGNPPFLGGLKVSGEFGDKYRNWTSKTFAPFGGIADICAAFFRRAYQILKAKARFGLVATNSIGQGDTREGSLAAIVAQGGVIVFAQRFVKWPGQANVEVNLVSAQKGSLPVTCHLDGKMVDFISSRLDSEPESEPASLTQNVAKAFQGDILRGVGFVLGQQEARRLLARNARNSDCLLPYLNGEDINTDPEQRPSRYVICFHDWDLNRARGYPDLLLIVETKVKPERDRLSRPNDRKDRERWWQFCAYRRELRHAIGTLSRVLVRSRVSELHSVAFAPRGWIYNEQTIVFAFDDYFHFALLQSNVHEAWVRRNASTMRTDIRYTPTDCFETFAFPQSPPEVARAEAERLGEAYHEHRRQTMLARQLGLTKTYNLFHKPACTDDDIAQLRDLHAAMDRAILACYGWTDLDPGHGFHANERNQTRYTISPAARREMLRRLLALNLEIAAREAATGGDP